jgi:hypothetical protein
MNRRGAGPSGRCASVAGGPSPPPLFSGGANARPGVDEIDGRPERVARVRRNEPGDADA